MKQRSLRFGNVVVHKVTAEGLVVEGRTAGGGKAKKTLYRHLAHQTWQNKGDYQADTNKTGISHLHQALGQTTVSVTGERLLAHQANFGNAHEFVLPCLCGPVCGFGYVHHPPLSQVGLPVFVTLAHALPGNDALDAAALLTRCQREPSPLQKFLIKRRIQAVLAQLSRGAIKATACIAQVTRHSAGSSRLAPQLQENANIQV